MVYIGYRIKTKHRKLTFLNQRMNHYTANSNRVYKTRMVDAQIKLQKLSRNNRVTQEILYPMKNRQTK